MKLLLLALAKPLAGLVGFAGWGVVRSVEFPDPDALQVRPAPLEQKAEADELPRPQVRARARARVEIVPADPPPALDEEKRER